MQQQRYDRICGLCERLPCLAGRPVVTTVILLFLFLILSNKKNMKGGRYEEKEREGNDVAFNDSKIRR
jgi:hypothetical protein